jgi:DNA-binding response OmpR family regulator
MTVPVTSAVVCRTIAPPGRSCGGSDCYPVAAMPGDRPRVLLCDDAPGFRVFAQTILQEAGLVVAAEAESWAEAEQLAAAEPYDAVLLDLWLPVFDLAAVVRVRSACPSAVLAVISSLAVDEVARLVDGVEGIDLVLSKRDSPDAIVAALQARLGA